MDKEKFEILAMDFMSGEMSHEAAEDFRQFLEKNPNYKEEYKQLESIWTKVDAMQTPDPSTEMDETFYGMLGQEIEKSKKKRGWNGIFSGFFTVLKPQLVYGVLLLGVGFLVGLYFNSQEAQPGEIMVSTDETADVRQKLVLTLLEQPSANQRLQGVSEANKIEDADNIVIQALLQTLNNDANVNVRLAAIESLTNYVDNPVVRQGLVQAIPHQESPIIQITLANLMVALQEKASIEPFKQLLKEKQVDTTVKKRIEKSIQSII
ncbi:HEAT repeat domain-containing protein [Flagellimonas nanhaiensis]|nr:HEAT repeat domain-containing protein [Allomuricauda nanhaiensis]